MEVATIIKIVWNMRKTFFLIMAVLLSVSASFAEKKKKTVVASTIQLSEQEIIYNEGIEMLKKGDYNEAATRFTLAISIDSMFVNAYYNRAIAYTEQGVYNRAMNDIETAIRLFGSDDNADNHILKAKIHYGIGDVAGATNEIERALEMSPSNNNALLDKAAIYQATGKYDLAMSTYIKYNYKTGGDAYSYNELGNCYNKTGDKRVALDCYRKAYYTDSTNVTVKFNLAKSIWELDKDTVKALSLVDELIKADLTNAEYYNLKGYIYYQAGDTAKADTNFDLAIKNNNNLAQAHNGKGLIQIATGNYTDAIKHFNNAIAANINYADAYINRGIAKEEFKDYDGACEDFRRAAELGDASATAYFNKQCK